MRILIVDDSANQRQLLQHFLTQDGFTEIILAESAIEAFAHLGVDEPDTPPTIDLILMDILMPEINGIEACQQIKATEHLRDIPIIMITGMSDMENLDLAFKAGAMDYIVKPPKKQELLARVHSLLQLKQEMDTRKAQEKALIHEIEERKQVEAALKSRNQELMLLNQVGRMFSSSIELDRTLVTVLRSVRQLLNVTSTSFWLRMPDTGELVCQQAIGPKSEMVIGWRLPPGQGIVGRAAQTGEIINVADARTDPHYYGRIDQHTGIEFLSNLSIPFQIKGQTIGVLSLVDVAVGRFSDDDIRLLEPIAAAAATAVENARLYTLTQWQKEEAEALNHKLDTAYQFIRQTFGRYLSDEIVETILETPEGLQLGGEKRTVTIMMTDVRGFTSISEHLPAEGVVNMINTYFEIMTEIIFKYQGTINEFLGDAIFVMFGAPIVRANDAQRAVACAVEMQLAMQEVNRRNQAAGYPEMAMGIGINTGEAVVGNIGSRKRTKYGVVGRQVNLTNRIESYSVGGQILISESTREACGDMLRIDAQVEIKPKGVKTPITVYDIGGIRGDFNIFLPEKEGLELRVLPQPLPVKISVLEGKYVGKEILNGRIVRLKAQVAEIQTQRMCRLLTNLKITLFDLTENQITADLYAKVTGQLTDDPPVFQVHFTSMPPEVKAFFKQFEESQTDEA